MPRIKIVKSAQKDQGPCYVCRKEIKQGETYKWFAHLIGRSSRKKKFCAKCKIRGSHMTTSDKLCRLYEAQEAIEDALKIMDDITTIAAFEEWRDNVASAIETAAQTAEEVGDEYQSSYDNMPEGLQQGSTGQEIEEKANACSEWNNELETAAGDVQDVKVEYEVKEPEPESSAITPENPAPVEQPVNEELVEKIREAIEEVERIAEDASNSLSL